MCANIVSLDFIEMFCFLPLSIAVKMIQCYALPLIFLQKHFMPNMFCFVAKTNTCIVLIMCHLVYKVGKKGVTDNNLYIRWRWCDCRMMPVNRSKGCKLCSDAQKISTIRLTLRKSNKMNKHIRPFVQYVNKISRFLHSKYDISRQKTFDCREKYTHCDMIYNTLNDRLLYFPLSVCTQDILMVWNDLT